MKKYKWSDHHGNQLATVWILSSPSFPWLSQPFTTSFDMVGTCCSRHVSQHLQQCEKLTCFYLLGLSLRLVLLARKELCSWLSSNGSRALERKPCEKGKTPRFSATSPTLTLFRETHAKGQKRPSKIVFFRISRLEKRERTNRHLCDVLNEVLAEGESAAYEPHGNYMMGQRYDILVESRRLKNGQRESVRSGILAFGVQVLTWKG